MDNSHIHQLRQSRSQLEARLLDNRNHLVQLEAEMDRLVRIGAQDSDIIAAEKRRLAAQETRRDLLREVAGLNDEISETVIAAADVPEEDLFKRLEGDVPIALLPVRLETRFFSQADDDQLRIRIYPDQIHIDNHPNELLPQEIELGKQYWTIRRNGSPELQQAAWSKLAQQFSATRAAWIVHCLTPANLDAAGGKLEFPDVAVRLDSTSHVPRARLLPERWVAVGFERNQTNSYDQLFLKWGDTVPDSLSVGLSFDDLSESFEEENEGDGAAPDETDEGPDEREGTLPVDDEMKWAVDYDEAQRVGMAISVEDSDLPPGKRLADGIDLLVVLGVDWTLSPKESVNNFANLLVAHHYSDGMVFVPQGTPTNNTGPVRSGFTTDAAALARQIDPAEMSIPTTDDNAALRMTRGLGLSSQDTLLHDTPLQDTLLQVPNAGLREQAITSAMVDSLWESTLGYFLDVLMDPLVTDAFMDLARDHAADFLQPFGPFAAIRIGKQPYGLIPMMSLDDFKPDRTKGVEETLGKILKTFINYWREGLDNVPYMGKSGDPDQDLLAILQLNQLSIAKKFRRVFDSETTSNATGSEEYAKYARIQADLRRILFFEPLSDALEVNISAAKLAQMTVLPTDYPLFGPWVQAGKLEPGAPLEPNYIEELISFIKAGTEGRKQLHKRTSSRTLLHALLAFATLRELDRAGAKILDEHLIEAQDRPSKSTVPTRSLTGIYTAPDAGQNQDIFIETPRQQAALVLPDLTGDLTLSDFISQELGKPSPEIPASLRNLDTFVESLEQLATYPVAEIDRSFRSVLDCYSYRLDAWLTSLASRRLQQVRNSRPVGLYTGGYGWVENLRPDTQPDSLGYVHTPSLTHASTAAMMHSAHISHRGHQNSDETNEPNPAESVLNIDLSSKPVHEALHILDGASQGRSLAELLGYRFERQLRDNALGLMQFITPLRKIAPLRPSVPDMDGASRQNIAARDVVDVFKLLEAWRQDNQKLFDQIQDPAPNSNEREMLDHELRRIDNVLNAVSDVQLTELMYQTVQGNYERAGAVLSALDRQARPPEPQVVRTPRSGLLYQQRVMMILQEINLPPSWQNISIDLRAKVEPRLNAWVAALLGDPQRFKIDAQVRDGDNSPIKLPPMTLLEFLQETKLSALSLVLISAAADARMPSELEFMLAGQFAEKVQDPKEGMTLEILDEPPASDEEDTLGFAALQALLQMIQEVLSQLRSADARDFIPAGDDSAANVMTDELRGRLTEAKDELTGTVNELNRAIDAEQLQALREALLRAVHLAVPDAYPETTDSDPDALQTLLAQAVRVLDTLEQRHAQITEKEDAFAQGEDIDEALVTNHVVQLIRIILGESFPILPLFSLKSDAADESSDAAQELAASLGDRESLIGDDGFAPLTWLEQIAAVRPQIEKLVSVFTASEMLGSPLNPEHFQIMQVPHRPGQLWAGLGLPEPPDELEPENEPTLALLAIGQFSLLEPMAGFVCDGWSELIPAPTEMTGLTFHYDAPAARAPQSIVLVVPPALDQANWEFDCVLDTVCHTHELARLRALGPKELPEIGSGALPMLFVPQDRTKQIPSVDFAEISEQTGQVIGKMNSHAS